MKGIVSDKMALLTKLFSHKKRLTASIATAVTVGYLGICAPTYPYLFQDINDKRSTSQNDLIEMGKSLWGAFVWYPFNKIKEIGDDSLEEKTIVVNKATQELFVYSATGKLELQTPTSTGRDQGIKRTETQKVTPFGKYIAVQRWNTPEELANWYGEDLAPLYGQGGMLFLGKWFPHIAVHGTTTDREKQLGTNVSNGCPRIDSNSIEQILETAATGSTLTVHEYAILPRELPTGFDFGKYQHIEFFDTVNERITMSPTEVERDFLLNNPFISSLDDLRTGQTYFFRDRVPNGSFNGDDLIGGIDYE